MAQKISPERQALYTFGIGLTVFGVLLIVIGVVGFMGCMVRDVSGPSFSSSQSTIVGFWVTAALGMGVVALGQVVRHFAARGVAGAGLVLDPERARKDLEPWSRMGGGMIRDALDQSGIKMGGTGGVEQNAKLPFDEELRRLKSLKDDGLISEAEFEAARKKILERLQ
ncbi:MAG: SHOCT domain-containing protein [Phycisphaerales bacterium]|nr:SHOCT domain-containing protein [Phycisphaerales bacterium]